jgi:signal peptidase II
MPSSIFPPPPNKPMLRFDTPQKLGVGLALAVIAVDQVSKLWLYERLTATAGGMIEVLPFFNLVMVRNYGVSFGLFNNGSTAGSWMFVALALAIVAVLVRWLLRASRTTPAVALGLVIGGAIGNVIDRLRMGSVFDFLDVHVMGWHWPAFNIADSGITVGVALLFIDSLFGGAEESKKGAS